ncbi:MAG: hypothetical protein HDR11_05050 [Lachnospiraceae bacterium]|nr:hypothetical protein [Lachnospiraceae bacterium]
MEKKHKMSLNAMLQSVWHVHLSETDVNATGYDSLVEILYQNIAGNEGNDIDCERYNNLLCQLEELVDSEHYMELEDLVTEGFSKSGHNGFQLGFRCAMTIMSGSI